jgi:hypothetical protein
MHRNNEVAYRQHLLSFLSDRESVLFIFALGDRQLTRCPFRLSGNLLAEGGIGR